MADGWKKIVTFDGLVGMDLQVWFFMKKMIAIVRPVEYNILIALL